jgi:hypothetical protein
MAASDLTWVSESRLLGICSLPRSTFQSWIRSGLNLADEGGAYGLREVIALTLLAAARDHAGVEELIAGWRRLERSGGDVAVIDAARGLQDGARMDLVLDPSGGAFAIARNDVELVEAIRRHRDVPRPLFVVDVAARIRFAVDAFESFAKATPRPVSKRPGRPKREVVSLRAVDGESSS